MNTESLKTLTENELYGIRDKINGLIEEINRKQIEADNALKDKEAAEQLAKILKNKKVANAVKVLKSIQKKTKKHFKIVIDFDMEYSLPNPNQGFEYRQTNIKTNIKDKALHLQIREYITDACGEILRLSDLTKINKARKAINDNLDRNQINTVFNK